MYVCIKSRVASLEANVREELRELNLLSSQFLELARGSEEPRIDQIAVLHSSEVECLCGQKFANPSKSGAYYSHIMTKNRCAADVATKTSNEALVLRKIASLGRSSKRGAPKRALQEEGFSISAHYQAHVMLHASGRISTLVPAGSWLSGDFMGHLECDEKFPINQMGFLAWTKPTDTGCMMPWANTWQSSECPKVGRIPWMSS